MKGFITDEFPQEQIAQTIEQASVRYNANKKCTKKDKDWKNPSLSFCVKPNNCIKTFPPLFKSIFIKKAVVRESGVVYNVLFQSSKFILGQAKFSLPDFFFRNFGSARMIHGVN